jgi:hypothetical protein
MKAERAEASVARSRLAPCSASRSGRSIGRICKIKQRRENSGSEDDRRRGRCSTHRTSMVRASEDARRVRSFSSAGGRTGWVPAPVDELLPLLLRASSAAWIVDCGAFNGRCNAVKRLGGRARTMLYKM